ncbi:hypothetical protein [Bradyrhizobium sp. ORS 285]|uniref:hypothetical protein n=1 Tax=Bradyrhizobium sp. ORS 285 TaxID=115808 RepID=UPI00031A5874|nr:hypothetical protein [Bradyrhizobium sp. ORS 285]
MLADPIDEQNQPVKDRPLRRLKIRPVAELNDSRPKFGPAVIELDQVARLRRPLTGRVGACVVFLGSAHANTIVWLFGLQGVKNT